MPTIFDNTGQEVDRTTTVGALLAARRSNAHSAQVTAESAEESAAAGVKRGNGGLQFRRLEEFEECGGLAPGQHQPVKPFEVLRQPDLHGVNAGGLQGEFVPREVAL